MDFLVFILILCAGTTVFGLVEREMRRRRKRRREAIYGPEPVCGCKHHYSFHNPKTGLCKSQARTAVRWDGDGAANRWELRSCGCQRYVGPQPLESFHAPEITQRIAENPQD